MVEKGLEFCAGSTSTRPHLEWEALPAEICTRSAPPIYTIFGVQSSHFFVGIAAWQDPRADEAAHIFW